VSTGFELFSDIFARRDNWLSRRDVRVKLVAALAVMLAVLLSGQPYLPAAVCAACFAATLSAGMPARMALARLAVPFVFAAIIVALKSVLDGSTVFFRLPLGVVTVPVLREGLSSGLLIGSRVLGAVSVMLLLSVVTPAHRIFAALRWAGMPAAWTDTAMLMYRYIFALLDHAATVYAAQRVRLGYSGVRSSLRCMGLLAGSVVDRSLGQATRTYEALVTRGYTGELPSAPMSDLDVKDVAICAVPVALAWAAFVLLEYGI
jgi:cobalt/nickel transport system permease protein